jgi:hypothetical protein
LDLVALIIHSFSSHHAHSAPTLVLLLLLLLLQFKAAMHSSSFLLTLGGVGGYGFCCFGLSK